MAKIGRLVTKRRIAELASKYPECRQMAAMAELWRAHARQDPEVAKRKKKRKRKAKKDLKPTDWLSLKQLDLLLRALPPVDPSVKRRTRQALNRMLLLVLCETGMRVTEACRLRLKSLPTFHGKQCIEVLDGKGKVDRTIWISIQLVNDLAEYCRRYHRRGDIENYLFVSERGGHTNRYAVYGKFKRLASKAGLWIYFDKKGRRRTKMSPHKCRHTNATHLLDFSKSRELVQANLGHVKADTTNIYAKVKPTVAAARMNDFSQRLRAAENAREQKELTPEASEQLPEDGVYGGARADVG